MVGTKLKWPATAWSHHYCGSCCCLRTLLVHLNISLVYHLQTESEAFNSDNSSTRTIILGDQEGSLFTMMTSSKEIIFRVTDPLCGEFTGPRWIPVTKAMQWRGALMFSLICTWINGWVNNREAGDLRRHCAHYEVIVMALNSSNMPTNTIAVN